jgi:phage gp36-like protein
MTYATQADMVDRFGETELSQRTNRVDGTTIDTTVLGRALADADAEIDGYLAGRYALPLATVPTALVRVACDVARYRLYDDGITDVVRQRYEDATSFLKRISSGDVVLGDLAAATESADVGLAYHQFTSRQITDDSMRGFA